MEDLEEPRLGRLPAQTFPAQAPSFAYGIANTVHPGVCAGEFLLGADEIFGRADGRGREEVSASFEILRIVRHSEAAISM